MNGRRIRAQLGAAGLCAVLLAGVPVAGALISGALVSGALITSAAAAAEWELPRALRDTVNRLDPEQRAFITSGAALDYLPARQLEHELTTRDAASIRTLVGDLMAVAAEMGYDPARHMGAMPLNLTTDRFNLSGPTPAPLRDFERAPGPFSVHRYLFPETGVPTFAGAKVAIYPEDLVAGRVDVAIIGIPNDMGSGRRNAEHGPRMMRMLDTIATPDIASLLDPMQVLSVVDYGDFSTDNMSTERTVGHVADMVAETAATGAVPMLVGGDTSMLYPGVQGVARVHGDGSFGLVHFSAHPDVDRHAVHTISDTRAVFSLLDEGVIRGRDLIAIGLRGESVDIETLSWLRGEGVRYHTMAEIRRRGFDAVLERVMRAVDRGPERLFVSIDVSVIEPAEMVAAGRIVAGGLRMQEVTDAIRRLCATKEIVGFEITDMAPMLDLSRLSTLNANAVLNACLVGMAVRAAGHSPDYVHPLALDHGQR